MDSDLERFLVLWLCILTYDLPPTQTLDWNVALTATPGMLTIWHVLEAMARDLHVTTCLASLRSEDELSYIIYICVSLKRQSMELDIDSSTKVWYHSLLEGSWEFEADQRKNFSVIWWQINRICKEISQSENIFFFL